MSILLYNSAENLHLVAANSAVFLAGGNYVLDSLALGAVYFNSGTPGSGIRFILFSGATEIYRNTVVIPTPAAAINNVLYTSIIFGKLFLPAGNNMTWMVTWGAGVVESWHIFSLYGDLYPS